MRREISWVRPPSLPLTDSRSLRVVVARGSIEYSAVTHPLPESFNQRGTPGENDAVHSTLVRPKDTRAEPSACSDHARSKVTGRSSSWVRPSDRVIPASVMARPYPRADAALAVAPDPLFQRLCLNLADLWTEESATQPLEFRRIAGDHESVLGLRQIVGP